MTIETQIPITRPLFGEEEFRAVQEPLESGWIVQGPFTAEFERRFATYTNIPHAAASSSCTTGLQIAVAALGLEPGDEVIVPAFTWVSAANVIEVIGAKPVFCDIDLATFNLDVGQLESLVTERTVGIIPVHLFGLCAEMPAVLSFSGRHGLWVVEDAACALGSWLDGVHAGAFGDLGCFSFHPRKSITTGEGGMLTTRDPELDTAVRSIRDHGASRSEFERHGTAANFLLSDYDRLGFNYRMTDIQGALGCAQMDRLDAILERRRELAAAYDDAFLGLEWLRIPTVPEGYVHGYQAYVTLYAPEEPTVANMDALFERRIALMARLESEGIATRQGTHAAALTDYYRERYGIRREEFPRAALAESLTIALPLFPQLDGADQGRVIESLSRG